MIAVVGLAVVALLAAVVAVLFYVGGKRATPTEADSYSDEQRSQILSGVAVAPSKVESPRTSTGDN